MNLFDYPPDKAKNWLPGDGIVHYFGRIWTGEEADIFMDQLQNTIAWKHDEVVIFGKKIVTRREVAWYGDEGLNYTYSGSTKQALPWTPLLQKLKSRIAQESGESFNSCLLNLYHDGTEGMGWHSDDEKDLEKDGAIASISLGAERKFVFRHKKSKEKVELILEHGSLLIMKGKIQTYWQHSLPVSKKIKTPRINLTFRTIVK